ncbi:hypothetical protein MKW98_019795 [Papaver atlanticum]|uniref:TOG domain-containing protein n=1 Tax=Papaver atlanticum TaxID=357466 RepID=A0AAD4TFJ3_9MAGN|nr:hypothetical protein MKW98_019795 [Papaver atlanticum]
MANEGGSKNLEGILKWSLAHSDGTRPSREISEEDKRWFMEAMQAQTVDVVKRMKEITLVMKTPENVLEEQGVTSAEIEDLLDELQEHVESIDMANDLHTIGGLSPLLEYLKNSSAGIRAKAAEVITTIVQNNPKSQQLVMEANGLEPLLSNLTSDPDVTARTKALGAISSLIRHNKPGVAAFRLANGYGALRDALSSDNVRFQRKALSLVEYLLQENSSDCSVITELGFPRTMMHLVSSEDIDVREAALRGLLELSKDEQSRTSSSSVASTDNEKLKQVLEERVKAISAMTKDELGAVMDESHLIDSLWSVCYNEPSYLRKKGLLDLPGDDAPPPDVASSFFQPALRALATDNKSTSEKKKDKKEEPPLLLGLGPPSSRND